MRRYLLPIILALLTAGPALVTPSAATAEISEKLHKELDGYVEQHLAEGDAEVKSGALLTLGYIAEDKEAREKLAEYTTSGEARVRLGAKMGLYLAEADEADENLLKELATQSGLYGVLRQRVTVLPDEMEAELLEALLGHEEAGGAVKEDVFRYLAEQESPELFGVLTDKLEDDDQKVRAAAVKAAKYTARNEVLEPAREMLDSDDESMRETGLELILALSRLPGRSSKAIPALEAAVEHDSDEIARKAAFRLLELHNKAGVDRLLKLLEAPDGKAEGKEGEAEKVDQEANRMRKRVARKLLASEVSPPTDTVKPLWKTAKDDELKQLLLELTVASGDSGIFKKMVEQFGSTTFDERLVAARALGRSENAKAVDMLSRALFEGSVKMRRAAAKSLRQIGSPKALPALKRAIQQERDKAVKTDVIRALGVIGSDKALQILQFNSTTRDADIKSTIVAAVGDAGKPEGMQVLKLFFSARNLKIQWQAFLVGLQISPKEVMGRIDSMFRNPPSGFAGDLQTLELPTLKKVYAKLLRHDNDRVRRTIVRNAKRIGAPMYGLFREAVNDDDVSVDTRKTLLFALSEVKRKNDRIFFQKLVRTSTEEDLTRRAAWTLAEYEEKSLEAVFRGWLTKDDSLMKVIATYGIAGMYAE